MSFIDANAFPPGHVYVSILLRTLSTGALSVGSSRIFAVTCHSWSCIFCPLYGSIFFCLLFFVLFRLSSCFDFASHKSSSVRAIRTHVHHKSIFRQCKFSHRQIRNNVQAFHSAAVSDIPQCPFIFRQEMALYKQSFPPSLLTKKESDFDCRMHAVGDSLSNIANVLLLIS
ncbi:hypothetical protein GGI42DRAFT_50202 [Trichoderma sp. SZMC 28013]